MRKLWNIKSDAGTLMIEAMAMLALIAMVTPILYKKAAERTVELQDINAASQMRVMSKALDDYLRDNYADIMNGRTVTNDCGGAAASVQYTDLADTTKDEAHQVIEVGHLCDYLPYGFIKADGTIQGSRTFDGYRVAIARKTTEVESPNDDGTTTKKDVSRLTGFVIADPKGDLPMLRASRIASMIGSNGGYAQEGDANGVQGVWHIDGIQNTFGLTSAVADGAIITSSIQPISDGSSLNENVLYRKEYPGRPDLNTMETTLHMGGNNIDDINKLIVEGNDLDPGEAGLEINKGGIDVGNGNFTVNGDDGSFNAAGGGFEVDASGNATMGNATVDGSANIAGDTTVGGGLGVTGDTTIGGNTIIDGTTTIGGETTVNNNFNVTGDTVLGGDDGTGGNLTVNGSTTLNGPTTINNTLDVNGDADFGKNVHVAGDLTVDGNTTLNGPTIINNTLDVAEDANFAKNVTIGGNLTVEGELKSDNFKAKTLYGGLLGRDWSESGNDYFGFTAQWADGNPANSHIWAGPTDEFHITQGRLEFDTDGVDGGRNGGASDTPQFVIDEGVLDDTDANSPTVKRTMVQSGSFIVDTGAVRQVETDDDYVHFMKDGAGALLSISNDDTTEKGSVHIRKGVLEIESIAGQRDSDGNKLDAGYIKADRFVDNRELESDALPAGTNDTGYSANGVVAYDAYQVNPAYTSVMHDIKLTTRGGSRLSDILPDFINKGIYVVDNTYNEEVPYWGNLKVEKSGSSVVAKEANGKTCSSHTCWTSPWLGIIPAPQCPPGYARVVTITPAGWAMGQAGVPGVLHNKRQDLWTPSYPYNPSDPENPTPLYFQKSTWLRANVYPHGQKGDFLGWSAIMGFMYPYTYFKDYIDDLGGEVDKPSGTPANQMVIWNLFPVLKRQLEAYVTVYCYFDRGNTRYSDELVDKYDQLNNFRQGWTKDTGYVDRLNDPDLNYYDPW